MRLAFCFMSNKIEKLRHMHDHFIYDLNHVSNQCVDTFSVNVLTNPPIHREFSFLEWNFKWVDIRSHIATDFFTLRQESIKMAPYADIIYIGDDDMEFREGSTEVINHCTMYMENHKDCGAIYLGGNFGGEGAHHGGEIFISNTGSFGINRGVILRNRPELLDNRLHALGACEDAIMGFTALMQGYYIARKLNIQSIYHESAHRIGEDAEDINYNLPYIRNYGFRKVVGQVIGPWESRTEWPKDIWHLYLKKCKFFRCEPRYDENGSIV
jgi:hypothetical protein